MRKHLYTRLAVANMVNNRRTYVPYLLTCIITVATFFVMHLLASDQGVLALPAGGRTLRVILNMGIWVIMLFAAIFLFYTHSFLIKRRNKELGLYNILGMEKKHLAKLMALETLFTAVIALVVGMALGLLMSQLLLLLLLKLMNVSLTFTLTFSWASVAFTCVLFGAIFLLTLLYALWRVYRFNPIELLKEGSTGEREPKNKWLVTLLGVLTLGAGYTLAIIIDDPATAIMLFFVAVILVIIGTYLLFTAGSVTLLKILRKNKKYYYQPNHFISVSGMMYRMKRNAVGLANICILSTMVLVMMSSTTALMAGIEKLLDQSYPHQYELRLGGEINENSTRAFYEIISKTLQDQGAQPDNEARIHKITSHCDILADKSLRFAHRSAQGEEAVDFSWVTFLDEESYNGFLHAGSALAADEVMVFGNMGLNPGDTLRLDNASFRVYAVGDGEVVAEKVDPHYLLYTQPRLYIVATDLDVILEALVDADYSQEDYVYQFDTNLNRAEQEKLHASLQTALYGAGFGGEHGIATGEKASVSINSRANYAPVVYELFAGLFFLGLFLGLLFLMATVLILYYKQTSEGYEDKARFAIMRSVGLSRSETKRIIHSQTLTLFFLPLVASFLHLIFAFPLIRLMMDAMQMPPSTPFLAYAVGTCVLFAVFYVIVYLLTARTYTKIVGEK